MPDFTHLHVHTQYSLLDGAAAIPRMMQKAQADGMKAIALTDHGNMFGAFNFVNDANKYNLKPIVGCEFYVVEDRHKKVFTKEKKDRRFHQLLLAKNKTGYKNLSKLCSLGYMEGLYSKWPRIDKELVLKYKEGLIATTCCIGAEVPQAILNKSEEEAEKIFKWWYDVFGDDYYIELQRHGLENIDGTGMSQEDVNQVLLKWSKKYKVPAIATNDSHYVEEEDANAHDILLCVNTGDLKATPIGVGKGYRFGFPNEQFFFKNQEQMNHLFKDIPESIDNTNQIVDKVERISLERDILLPNFALPKAFSNEDDYLKHLSYEGAKKRYGELTQDAQERLDHELHIIKTMGFAGYFLIVQDLITAAKAINVAVGPGRGSAAGSAVAYCIGITNIDPIKYSLIFERFLNPERVSMPDIDIDFDDEGRQKVIDYVVDKYGKNQVAQIITYGKMAAKMAVRDVSRVLDLPLPDADKLAKTIPSISLQQIFNTDIKVLKSNISAEEMEAVKKLREIQSGKKLESNVLKQAELLEGSIRNTGIHAAGIIIAPDDLTEYIPVCTSKDSELLITQFEGKTIESAGMLKMDFLGLKTLTIIKGAIELIKRNHNVEIDPDEIPLDDNKTFALYQDGATVGTFQFESAGMQKHLITLKPTDIEDLIAMNALYRPGPMQFIDKFIKRKHGTEKVEYPHELLKPILENTYGIMVYQEQIMQTAQILAGYSLGEADLLRRAMGKKKMDVMQEQRAIFIKGSKNKHDIDEKKSSEIFDIMIKFAEYGFNRSHSAAYSLVAFQTAYLKANYPSEYMASVLTNNMNNLDKLEFFLKECQRMKLSVLGPDVNQSDIFFNSNAEGALRFGLNGIKGVGENAVMAIVEERLQAGPYQNLLGLTKRINLRTVNKRCIENLVLAGAMDCFEGFHRAQYFYKKDEQDLSIIEKSVKLGNKLQSDRVSMAQSLFGDSIVDDIQEPVFPECEHWADIELLSKEKEVVGIYLSGHPLDDYSIEVEALCKPVADIQRYRNKDISVAGIVTASQERMTKRGKRFGLFTIEDYSGSTQLALFGEDYLKFRHFLVIGEILFMKGNVQLRFKSEDQYELKIYTMQLINGVREEVLKNISLDVPIAKVNSGFIDILKNVCEAHKGKHQLLLNIIDGIEKMRVETRSKKYMINISKDLLEDLDDIKGIRYRVN
jgi:DNA polymerase-3 subunit alpha